MSDRVSEIVLLCEDDVHHRFVCEYMKLCKLATREPQLRSLVASRLVHGGNVDYVLRRFVDEVHACRQRNAKARTKLLVMADADLVEVEERRKQFDSRLKTAGELPLAEEDPVVVLIPRRNGETWIQSLLGRTVDESTDYKKSSDPSRNEIRQAARTAYDWARPNAPVGTTCVPSLQAALESLRQIG